MHNPDAPNHVNTQTSDLPIAHIEAQDLSLTLPIREYLELNGCAVVINRNPAIAPTYYIVIGDEEFVKETVAGTSKKSIQTFAIIFPNRSGKIIPERVAIHAKIAYVRPQSLDTREAERIFAYFFTGGNAPYHSSGSVSHTAMVKPVPVEIPIEYQKAVVHDADTAAVGEEIHQRRDPLKLHDRHDEGRVSRLIDELFSRSTDLTSHHPQNGKKHLLTANTPRMMFVPTPVVSGRAVRGITFLFLCVLFFPVIWYILAAGLIGVWQNQAFQSMKSGNAKTLENAAANTAYWSGQGQRTLQFMGTVAGSVGLEEMLRNQERQMSVAAGLGDVEMRAARLMRESITLAPLLFQTEHQTGGESLVVAVDRMRTNLDDLSSALGLVSAQLDALGEHNAFPFQFISGRNVMTIARSHLSKALIQVSQARNLLSLYRVAGGFNGKKTYLLILQNSMELRPTGGFIGSIATNVLDNGKMEPPQIQDVYAVDGQLKGHIDPPVPIKELLEQEHWYLRDSNWNPDFAESGQKAVWFYEKETGVQVDGVIAISTPLLTELLGAIGPVELPDYHDRISKDNFFGKSLFYTKADFFPGSTQKKDFLGSLGSAILGHLAAVETEEGSAVFSAISTALLAGEIQFWFPDHKTQGIAAQAGWAGTLMETSPCQLGEFSCTVNGIAIVEANMGVNKVNAYMSRTIKSRVDIDEQGIIDGSVTITFENASTNDAAITGGGVYLSYLRSYFPRGTLIVSVTQDGREILTKPASAQKQQYPYRDPDAAENGQTVVSIAHTVVPMSSRTITIRYQLEAPLAFTGNEGVFMHTLRKQPGVTQTAVDIAIGYPSGWVAVPDQSDGVRSDNGFLANVKEVRYNTTLDQTRALMVKFRK